jgi:hypothetical protein
MLTRLVVELRTQPDATAVSSQGFQPMTAHSAKWRRSRPHAQQAVDVDLSVFQRRERRYSLEQTRAGIHQLIDGLGTATPAA